MKWDCGPTPEERLQALQKWHKWFAWRPVQVASHDCRWLEYIERKGTYCRALDMAWWDWEFRAPEGK